MRIKVKYGKTDFAQDVAQEIFLRLLRKPPQGVANPTAYVMKAADNIAYDSYQKQKLGADIEDFYNLSAKESYTDREDIKEILALLTLDEREIITLKIYGGYKFDEISQEKGINASTARSIYRRALKKCEKLYKEREK